MNRVAMVFQQFGPLPWRTVAENVGFGLALRGMDRTARAAIVSEKLELLNLAQWKASFTHELSIGMQQTDATSRAIATDHGSLPMDTVFFAPKPLIHAPQIN